MNPREPCIRSSHPRCGLVSRPMLSLAADARTRLVEALGRLIGAANRRGTPRLTLANALHRSLNLGHVTWPVWGQAEAFSGSYWG